MILFVYTKIKLIKLNNEHAWNRNYTNLFTYNDKFVYIALLSNIFATCLYKYNICFDYNKVCYTTSSDK